MRIGEIFAHVVKHAYANFTLDGVHKFWLPDSSDKVREVLEFLAEKKGWRTKKAVGGLD